MIGSYCAVTYDADWCSSEVCTENGNMIKHTYRLECYDVFVGQIVIPNGAGTNQTWNVGCGC